MSIQRGTKEETILTRLRILLVNYLISSFGNKKNLNESKSCLKSKFDFMRAASCRYTFSCCTSKLPFKIATQNLPIVRRGQVGSTAPCNQCETKSQPFHGVQTAFLANMTVWSAQTSLQYYYKIGEDEIVREHLPSQSGQ